MPKECKVSYCHSPVFSHSYCKVHQYLRQDGKKPKPLGRSTKRIQPVSDRRKVQMAEYTNEKEKRLESDRKAGEVKCFICDRTISKNIVPDIHHLDGREEGQLLDERYQKWVHRKCHTEVHNLSTDFLLQKEWYAGFLQRLKSVDENLYEREYEKRFKTSYGQSQDTTL